MRGRWLSIVILVVIVGAFGVILWRNASNSVAVQPLGIPTEAEPSPTTNPIAMLLQDGRGLSTPLPTVALNVATVTPFQVVNPDIATPTALSPADVNNGTGATGLTLATPTLPPPTPTLAEQGAVVTVQALPQATISFQPPPLIPPISRDPLGRDHYWLQRPIDSNAQNWVLSVYPYGSDGPDRNNPLRVHHGVDMPNPIGEIVRAAGSGTVLFAADGRQAQTDIFQNSPSYGNVIVIEHDFGYQGKRIWTLYAHLNASFVQAGQTVVAGEPIGQVGATGSVTGPHVHFEVRLGETADDNRYGNTYNPVLWMVPYVGHGVIAGRVVDANGNDLMDVDVTIRSRSTGAVEATTTTYVFLDSGFDVNGDPIWGENFAVTDIPVGRYDVIVNIDGQRLIQPVEVFEGTTSFVELKLDTLSPSPEATESPNGG